MYVYVVFYSLVFCFGPLLPKAGQLPDWICTEAQLPSKRKPTAHTEQTSNINEFCTEEWGLKKSLYL